MLSFKEYILENGGGGSGLKPGDIKGKNMPDKGTRARVIKRMKSKKVKVRATAAAVGVRG